MNGRYAHPYCPQHSPRHALLSLALLILFLTGCGGPTRTAGTKGMATKELAVLSVPQLPEATHLRIQTIQFNGTGEAFEIGKSRDFFLLPKNNTASFTLTAVVPSGSGMAAWLIPKDALTFPGPQGIPLGEMSAGKTYEFAAPTEGFDKTLATGQLSLVREKATK